MSRYRPYSVLFTAIVLALLTYGEMFSWFSIGALFDHVYPCVQNPTNSAPCYIGIDLTAMLVLVIALLALIVWYIASLICRAQGSDVCATLRAQRRREARVLGICAAALTIFTFAGSLVTKLTIHDSPAATPAQRQCGHAGERNLFDDPFSRVLGALGAVAVYPGETPFDARIQPYTIWRIPIDFLLSPQNYPHVTRGVSCSWENLTDATLIEPEALPEGWTPEELARYQSQLREQLATSLSLFNTPPLSVAETAQWKTYHSKECGFTFKYPATYFVTEGATTAQFGTRCTVGLMTDTQFSHDYIAGTLDADGVPTMTIVVEPVTPMEVNEGVVARAARATAVGDARLPQNPYEVVTFVGNRATLTTWQTIDIADTLSFYHGYRRYDLTMFGMSESMRNDFYTIIHTLRIPLDEGHFYSRDGTAVYYKDTVLSGALPDSFEYLGGGYVHGMDTVTEGDYAHDARSVYYAGKKIEGADVATFELMPRIGYAKDRHAQYAFGKKVQDDFVTCGTDLNTLPGGASLWARTIASLDARRTPTADSYVEYCTLKDGSVLMGFVPYSAQLEKTPLLLTGGARKHFYLFDAAGRVVHTQPAVLDCSKDSNSGWILPRSIDVLNGTHAKLQCAWDGACSGRSIYQLNISNMRIGEESITPTNEFYDCGYRG